MLHWHYWEKCGPWASERQHRDKAMPTWLNYRALWIQMYIYPRQISDCQGLHNVHAKSQYCKYFQFIFWKRKRIFDGRLTMEAGFPLMVCVKTEGKKITLGVDLRSLSPGHDMMCLWIVLLFLWTCLSFVCSRGPGDTTMEYLSLHLCLLILCQK